MSPGNWRHRQKKPRLSGAFSKRLKGLEPSTFCMASRRSSQLSYSRTRAESTSTRRAEGEPGASLARHAGVRRRTPRAMAGQTEGPRRAGPPAGRSGSAARALRGRERRRPARPRSGCSSEQPASARSSPTRPSASTANCSTGPARRCGWSPTSPSATTTSTSRRSAGRGLRATNTPDVLTNATAELAVALMLAAGRRIVETDADRAPRRLDRMGAGAVPRPGAGRGDRRAGRLRADRPAGGRAPRADSSRGSSSPRRGRWTTAARRGAGPSEWSSTSCSAVCDYVSLHVDLTPATRHLIDAARLAEVSRARSSSTRAGAASSTRPRSSTPCATGHLGGRGLDVYEDEPAVPAELAALPNTVLVPHIGSATRSTRDAMAWLCAENVIAVLDGRDPPTPVV